MQDTEKNSLTGRIEDRPVYNASALAPNITKRIIFGPERFWKEYTMRHFVLPPGCCVPPHSHEWDHFVLGIAGEGQIVVDGEVGPLPPGSWGHIPGGTEHTFENHSEEKDFIFICIVPTHGDPHGKRQLHRLERGEKKEKEEEEEDSGGC
jgi:quercetin dioxygenase-like cupin family protein